MATFNSVLTRRYPGNTLAIVDETAGTGSHYYVHSGTGSSSNDGLSPDNPKATIQQAIDLCTGSQGDHVWVMPGHAETLSAAAGILCDEIGVTISGIGNGTNRPTITLGTSVNTDVNVTAASVTIRNMRFVSAIDSLVNFLDLDAGNFTCEDCEFITSSALEVITFVDIATTFDNFTFRRCSFYQPTDPAGTDGNAGTGCFYFVDSENLFFDDCFFYGNFETAIWHNKTTAAKNVWLRRCYGTQLLSGAEIFTQVTAMEGGAQHCAFIIPAATDVTEALNWGTLSDKFFLFDSKAGNDGAGGQNAVSASTDAS